MVYVPRSYRPELALPLVLALHGAGGNALAGLGPMMAFADEFGLILLAPDSREQTWDVIRGAYGPDVEFIDQALRWVFGQYSVDSSRLAIEGFSDGASYAVSLGITNGDLFTHILAFSPGFAAPASSQGKPQVFISHGVTDRVLPIERCSRRLVPRLRGAQYAVRYREFDGGHAIPPEIAEEAIAWFLGAENQARGHRTA